MLDLILDHFLDVWIPLMAAIPPGICIAGIWIATSDYVERDWSVG